MSTTSTGTTRTSRTTRFPWPFPASHYRYSTNVEPARRPSRTAAGAWGTRILDVDQDYRAELDERRAILAADPRRCAVLPHMDPACWDALLLCLRELARDEPDLMSLTELPDGAWHWRNELLDVDQRFTLGDPTTLPVHPLEFLGQQVQEDVVLLDQREGALWADAGLVTFAADWSLHFDVGMSFLQIHGPVPRVHEEGVVPRAQQFLMRLQPGEPYRRTNWTLTVDHRLDTSTETYPTWGRDRRLLEVDEVGDRLHLRVEVQHLLRLPDTGCILFLIRTYLLPFADIVAVPAWRETLTSVLTELPADLVDYKGLSRTRDKAVAWLSSVDAAGTGAS